jgi:prepilin-type N-terminal cleavage/methylation domain-containing protein
MNRSARHPQAFTLVELILVMAILTILGMIAALGIPEIMNRVHTAQTQSTMRLFDIAIDQFKRDQGAFPTGTGADLVKYLTDPTQGWKKASLQDWFPKRAATLLDAWDNAFAYCSSDQYGNDTVQAYGYRGVERTPTKKDFYNAKTYQMYSLGPNGATWPSDPAKGGNPALGGTEPDDIRNWVQQRFYSSKADAGYP